MGETLKSFKITVGHDDDGEVYIDLGIPTVRFGAPPEMVDEFIIKLQKHAELARAYTAAKAKKAATP